MLEKPPSPPASGNLYEDKGWPLGGVSGYPGDRGIRGRWKVPGQVDLQADGSGGGRPGSPLRPEPPLLQLCTGPSWWSCL